MGFAPIVADESTGTDGWILVVKILHLTTFLQGGAGRVIATLASAQRASGHDVVVIMSATSAPGYGNYSGHIDTLARSGVASHAIDSLFLRDPAEHRHVIDFVESQYGGVSRFDVLHAHAAVPARIAMVLVDRAAARAPVLQTMHGWGIAKTPEQQKSDIAVLRAVDRVVVPDKTSARLLESLGVAATHVRRVPYGVAPQVERSGAGDALRVEMRTWQANGGVVICCAGTVGPRKNQRLLIEALPRIQPNGGVLCVFVGDGEPVLLQALAARAGVAGRVRFSGYRTDAREIVAASDFLVLPSISEGQPLSVLEAFCDGVPVLSSSIPELRELVADGVTGFLFDPMDANDLANAFSRARSLSAEGRAALCERARAQWESTFSVHRMCEGYMTEYVDLCVRLRAGELLQPASEIGEEQ
jgi:glycosyltransferase involved in cell wall biosynthesis